MRARVPPGIQRRRMSAPGRALPGTNRTARRSRKSRTAQGAETRNPGRAARLRARDSPALQWDRLDTLRRAQPPRAQIDARARPRACSCARALPDSVLCGLGMPAGAAGKIDGVNVRGPLTRSLQRTRPAAAGAVPVAAGDVCATQDASGRPRAGAGRLRASRAGLGPAVALRIGGRVPTCTGTSPQTAAKHHN